MTHGPCVRENKELRRHGAARAYKEAASAAVVHCAFVGFSTLTLESRVSTRTAQMSSAMASASDDELNDDEQNVPLLGSDAGNRSVSRPKNVKWGVSVVNEI